MRLTMGTLVDLDEQLSCDTGLGEAPGATERWRALARIARHAFACSDEREATGRVAEGFLRLLGGESAALFRRGTGKSDVLEVASAGAGPTDPTHAPDIAYPVVLRAIKERRAVAAQGELASCAVLAVPLRGREGVLGAIAVMHRPDASFAPLDVEIAETFADQAATFLEFIWRPADVGGHERLPQESQKQMIEAERLRAIGQLAGGVAHHLNNIMTVILGNIQVVLRSEARVGMRNHLQSAERAVLEAADVVRRMSAFSRVQPMPVQGIVDMNLLAADVLEWTRSKWEAEAHLYGIAIRARLEPGDVPAVRGDEPGLREVLLNLVLNAIDALPAGGDVVVRTWRGDTTVYCSVSDNGAGMTPETSQRALEPFFTTKGPQSRGLGLSVAYGIVQGHSGALAIESREGRGSTVTVSLPIGTSGAGPREDRAPAGCGALRILLIDDDPPVRTVLRAMLASEGHTVVEAADGADGLARVERGDSFDLVLTDLGMPGMNGWQVVRGVRLLRPELPVVLITGWDQLESEGGEVADAIVSKPVTDVKLRETIAGIVGRRNAAA
jgi:signal transduction histidine kinase/CheY-like chemotaxis protein